LGEGRKTKTIFRYIRLDRDIEFIPNNILLSAFNEKSLQDGYYGLNVNNPMSLTQLVMGDFRTGSIVKSKDTQLAIWSNQTVSNFPELIVSELDFKNQTTISITNPQQPDYVWPTAEIVEWISFSGDSLRGILYKPNNFDSTKKYPMISYFYERSSQGLHRYHVPQPSRSTINISFYVSNGYIVFVPDIVYRTGYPGQSAYDAIVSGVYHLINTHKYINSKKLGLQGQSWGGYQTAYLITQTDMFAAAMAGAPVSNMTSAYGGIRWGTGMSRMFQYEETQSRIGGTLWEKPLLYLENSPLFMAPRVTTPLLMMHNDNDGAVPWYQSIEMFMALYRLNKPVWLLNYNGMDHNLEARFWANRVDLDTRMFQFFNHYLKDSAAPKWMEKGIPAIDKGTDMAY
jgi:dipeptidyl aminopeptidase/acylaminoacyl peptidase